MHLPRITTSARNAGKILKYTTPSCLRSCLGCAWNFRHNNKMASAVFVVPPPPLQPLWPSVLLTPHPWDTARAAEKEGRRIQSDKTWWESTSHPNEAAPRWPNSLPQINNLIQLRGRNKRTGHSLPRQNAVGLKGFGYNSHNGRILIMCNSTKDEMKLRLEWVYVYMQAMCSKSHLLWDLLLPSYCPAIKAAKVWACLCNPSPLFGWKLGFNELCSAPPAH